MKKQLVLFFLLILATGILVAQEVDLLHLKNGSIIRGKLTEMDPQGNVKIMDRSGNLWVYSMDEVDRLSTTEAEVEEQEEQAGFHAGYINMTSMGFLAGSSANANPAPFSLLLVNGYRTGFGLFTGVGVGIEFFSVSQLPLFADIRMDLKDGDVVPYLVGKAGYSIPLASDYTEYDNTYNYTGGPLFAAGMGLKIRTREHFAWDVSLMYRYQASYYSEIYGWNGQEYDYRDNYNRIEIRIGFYLD